MTFWRLKDSLVCSRHYPRVEDFVCQRCKVLVDISNCNLCYASFSVVILDFFVIQTQPQQSILLSKLGVVLIAIGGGFRRIKAGKDKPLLWEQLAALSVRIFERRQLLFPL